MQPHKKVRFPPLPILHYRSGQLWLVNKPRLNDKVGQCLFLCKLILLRNGIFKRLKDLENCFLLLYWCFYLK